jgi:prephenate dehydratase
VLGLMEAALRIAFLGSSGSFSEEAARLHAERAGVVAELVGASAPAAVLALVACGAAQRAVLPVANTSSGLVWPVLSAIGASTFTLLDEVALPVRFSLFAARAGLAPAGIERVASHPQAFLQCTRALARLLPGRTSVAWSDTASAARDLAAGVLDERTAVLAARATGERFGLTLLADDVHDSADNRTFFAVLGAAPAATSRGRVE